MCNLVVIKMKIYAVIPAYNEEKTVGKVVEKTKDIDLVDEVIVVDDCSTDNTFQEAKKKREQER